MGLTVILFSWRSSSTTVSYTFIQLPSHPWIRVEFMLCVTSVRGRGGATSMTGSRTMRLRGRGPLTWMRSCRVTGSTPTWLNTWREKVRDQTKLWYPLKALTQFLLCYDLDLEKLVGFVIWQKKLGPNYGSTSLITFGVPALHCWG